VLLRYKSTQYNSWYRAKLKTLKELHSRFGTGRTLRHVAFRLINKFFYFDCLHIIVLDRDNLRSLDPDETHRLSAKIATLHDLKEMGEQGYWHIHQKKIEFFYQGDSCLLSYVDNELAGYTWAHTNGCPELVPGLRLSVPHEYLYNFAGFTHPNYRGYGLQAFRHHALLNYHRWKDRKGLLGFVVHTNYSSKRGQDKSGYQIKGNIWLIGSKSYFHAFIGKNLRTMGIKRINRKSQTQFNTF
jgi:GNAT superfamily N-acetyltransferase